MTRLKRFLESQITNEFLDDTKKQCVVLMGLPAAGKSTFINKSLSEYVPQAREYRVVNSDTQVERLQFETAVKHYNDLMNLYLENDIRGFEDYVKDKDYTSNQGRVISLPVTFDFFSTNPTEREFFTTFSVSYYNNFFDIRGLAKEYSEILFQDKVENSGALIVIDTVAANPTSLFKKLEKIRSEDYQITILYLEIDPKLSINRDNWRGTQGGRNVGVNVIMDYAKRMEGAYNTYYNEGNKPNGLVDKIFKFTWVQSGESPTHGHYKLVDEKNFGLQRKLGVIK